MMGGNSRKEQRYLKGHNNEDIYNDESKEKLFREYWSKIFQIMEEEIRILMKQQIEMLGII